MLRRALPGRRRRRRWPIGGVPWMDLGGAGLSWGGETDGLRSGLRGTKPGDVIRRTTCSCHMAAPGSETRGNGNIIDDAVPASSTPGYHSGLSCGKSLTTWPEAPGAVRSASASRRFPTDEGPGEQIHTVILAPRRHSCFRLPRRSGLVWSSTSALECPAVSNIAASPRLPSKRYHVLSTAKLNSHCMIGVAHSQTTPM